MCSMSRAKKARLTTEVATGPPALSWEHRSGDLATRLGRSGLWCLHCFRRPAGPYQAWLRERCREEQPIPAMPVALSSALLRAGPIDADTSDCLRRRLAVLLASARVARAAGCQPAGEEAGGRQVAGTLGRLLRGARLVLALVSPGPGPPRLAAGQRGLVFTPPCAVRVRRLAVGRPIPPFYKVFVFLGTNFVFVVACSVFGGAP